MDELEVLKQEVAACRICSSFLEHGVRPVVQMDSRAKILIAGQAPGRKVHESGIPFDDASGNRLRQWMGVSKEQFYSEELVAILPMGFCYPGTGKSGDLAPRPECAPAWRAKLLGHLPKLQLSLVIGQYAQDYHLGKSKLTVTEIVRSWRDHWPHVVPLPHPSPRNNGWLKRNPWFDDEVLPSLQKRIKEML